MQKQIDKQRKFLWLEGVSGLEYAVGSWQKLNFLTEKLNR